MYLMTVSEAARNLGITAISIRRGINAGKYAHLTVGNRMMVDVDDLEAKLSNDRAKRLMLMTVAELSELTGMSESMIRRAMRDGHISYERYGRAIMVKRSVAIMEINRMLAGDSVAD